MVVEVVVADVVVVVVVAVAVVVVVVAVVVVVVIRRHLWCLPGVLDSFVPPPYPPHTGPRGPPGTAEHR